MNDVIDVCLLSCIDCPLVGDLTQQSLAIVECKYERCSDTKQSILVFLEHFLMDKEPCRFKGMPNDVVDVRLLSCIDCPLAGELSERQSCGVVAATEGVNLYQKMKDKVSTVIWKTLCEFVATHKFMSSDEYLLPGSQQLL